ncbi:MAG: iron ABC transporter permease [Spirochaetaceae bacterium]|nr:MAG: iron ABC transporter permease [Spirochaetaceae bacterium]
MGLILIRSVIIDGRVDATVLFRTVSDHGFSRAFWNSITLGLLVVAGATALALPLAVITTRTSLRYKRWIDVVLVIPFLTPPYINALGWMLFMEPRGYLVHLAPRAGDWSAAFFSLPGMVMVMSLHLYPFLYLMLRNTLAQLSGSLDEAAAVSGARPVYRFVTVTLRLLVSGYAMGSLLVFVKTLSEFGTPITMGRRIGFPVLVTEIFRYTSSWPLDFGRGSRYAVLLLVLCLGAWAGQNVVSRRNAFHVVGGKGSRPSGRLTIAGSVVGWVYLSLLLTVSIGIPYFSITLTSLLRLRSSGIAWGNLTLAHYRAVLEPAGLGLQSLRWSLVLSLAAATVSAVLGTFVALGVQAARRTGHGSTKTAAALGSASDALALLPNTVPSIIVVLGLILMWNAAWMPVRVYNTPMMLVVTYVVLFLPFTVQYVKSSYEAVHPSLRAAGRVCGGSSIYVFLRVTLPLIAPGIVAGWIMTFAISFRELVGSLIVRPPSVHTSATFIYGQFEQGSVSQGMAMAVVSVGVTTAILLVARRFDGRRGGVSQR